MRLRLLFSFDKNRFNKEIKEIKENSKKIRNNLFRFFLLDPLISLQKFSENYYEFNSCSRTSFNGFKHF